MVSISSFYGSIYNSSTGAATRQSVVSKEDPSTLMAKTGTAQAGSVQKPFSEVVLNARKLMDEAEQKLGRVADEYTTWDQWNSALSIDTLDRRTLYAIASNQGGLFSDAEVTIAKSTMSLRLSQAMVKADPLSSDPAAAYKAGLDYLDGASNEEKASFDWAKERAAAQTGYEWRMQAEGRTPENVDSGNPFVYLIRLGHEEMRRLGDVSKSIEDMDSYQKALELWRARDQDDQPQLINWSL